MGYTMFLRSRCVYAYDDCSMPKRLHWGRQAGIRLLVGGQGAVA